MNCPVCVTGSNQNVSARVVMLCAILSLANLYQSRDHQIELSLVALGYRSIMVSSRILKLKPNKKTPNKTK